MNLKSIILLAALMSQIVYSNEKPSVILEVPTGPALTVGKDSFSGIYGNIGLEGYFQGESNLWGATVKASGELSLGASNGGNSWSGAAGLLRNQRLKEYYTLGITYGLGAYKASIIQNPENCGLLPNMNFGGDSDYCSASDLAPAIYKHQFGIWVPLKAQAGLRYKMVSLGVLVENSYLLSLSQIGDIGMQLGLGVYAALIF